MKEHKSTYPTTMMARLLKVSVSRFYDWLKRGMSKRVVLRNQQTILVKIAHQETQESYGHIRLTRHLQSLMCAEIIGDFLLGDFNTIS